MTEVNTIMANTYNFVSMILWDSELFGVQADSSVASSETADRNPSNPGISIIAQSVPEEMEFHLHVFCRASFVRLLECDNNKSVHCFVDPIL